MSAKKKFAQIENVIRIVTAKCNYKHSFVIKIVARLCNYNQQK